MHLRKSLVAVAAIVAASLIGLSSGAYATTGTISGTYNSGTVAFAGSMYGCTSGSFAGTYDTVNNPALNFSTVSFNCATPAGNATISLNSCTVPATLTTGRTSGLDTAIGGSAPLGSTCIKVSALGGLCTANVQGTLSATFNETTKVVGGVTYQDLMFNGSGALANQSSGCLGIYTGTFTLSSFSVNIAASGGPINFL